MLYTIIMLLKSLLDQFHTGNSQSWLHIKEAGTSLISTYRGLLHSCTTP